MQNQLQKRLRDFVQGMHMYIHVYTHVCMSDNVSTIAFIYMITIMGENFEVNAKSITEKIKIFCTRYACIYIDIYAYLCIYIQKLIHTFLDVYI
jgi:hypothetical protein